MHSILVKQSKLEGNIQIPSSKSQTLRALIFATLAEGKSIIYNPLSSRDVEAMIKACLALGAKIEVFPDRIEVEGVNGKIKDIKSEINAGNSGIVLRFCSAIAALSDREVIITGDHSIQTQRPMHALLSGLKQLGCEAESLLGNGYAPISIKGPIKAGKLVISGEDSQPVSALLIASAFIEGPVYIEVENPGEKPWISMTLDWFDRLKIEYTNQEYKSFKIKGPVSFKGFSYQVPGDLSSAAFPIAAALITKSKVIIDNVDLNDCQGDKELIHIFKLMGAEIEWDSELMQLHVEAHKPLIGKTVDINDFIDAITILAVVGCYSLGETTLFNASIAKHKECNRIRCIVKELQKMGADIEETEDGLSVRYSPLKGCELNSYEDHRMAMSLVVAGLGAVGETKIHPIKCIEKTFPTFTIDLKKIGANLCIETLDE